MIRQSLLAASSAVLLAACASEPAPATPTGPAAAVAVNDTSAVTSEFDLAMRTVEDLVEAGNEQVAIERLQQLVGSPELTDEQIAEALVRRAELKVSDRGYDTWGAIEDLDEVVENYADTDWLAAASSMRDYARGKATSLNFQLEQPETSRSRKFDLLMDLGEHEKAIDLMTRFNLTPSNAQLVAMYQIGYLCEGDTLTGQTYEATEPDGTARTLQFCDLGK